MDDEEELSAEAYTDLAFAPLPTFEGAVGGRVPRSKGLVLNESLMNKVCGYIAQGYSIDAACGHVGIVPETLYQWRRKYKEVAARVKLAEAKCLRWWEETARTIARDGGGNANMCIFALKNRGRHAWSESPGTYAAPDQVKPLVIVQAHAPQPPKPEAIEAQIRVEEAVEELKAHKKQKKLERSPYDLSEDARKFSPENVFYKRKRTT